MTDKNNPVAGAILANNVAWSSLVTVLINQGVVSLDAVSSDLLYMQQRYRDAGLEAVAEALDWYTNVLEGMRSAE
ncbi:hypothetical protein FES05_20050 [Salmonella enterica]|nr:hypothetical protein [Salmonella enterica]